MAEIGPVLLCAATMAALWGLIGLPVAVRMMPAPLSWLAAPGLGWAIYSVIALWLFSLVGMAYWTVAMVSLVAAIAAIAMLRRQIGPLKRPSGLLLASAVAAVAVSMVPLFGVLPKFTAEGVVLSSPIFDHSKVALIDEIIRSGVPPSNPFFSQTGTADVVSYYYLWHFSAAALAVMTGVSGWEADAALTGFTAFASVCLMIGVAVWISGHASAGVFAVFIAATGSLRPVVYWLLEPERSDALIQPASGFGSWFFQILWAPQHIASATSVVLACYLITQVAVHGIGAAVVLAIIAAAAFGSSIWVGGVIFPLAAASTAVLLLSRLDPKQRLPFAVHLAAAATMCLVLVIPILGQQIAASTARGTGFPITLGAVEVLGDVFSVGVRRLLDLPAFWLIYLPLEFPASYIAGLAGVFLYATRRATAGHGAAVQGLALLIAVSLTVAWLMRSVVAYNNDLGWRAVLPASILLIGFAAAAIAHWLATRQYRLVALTGTVAALALLQGGDYVRGSLFPTLTPHARPFAEAPRMWQAVRQHSTPRERVANNPDDLSTVTPWPVNISWALLSNRRSCYASNELAIAFASISERERGEIEAQFLRIFAGSPEPGDIAQLANRFACDVIVITPRDGAWGLDPFATSVDYGLVEERAGAWKIYKRLSSG